MARPKKIGTSWVDPRSVYSAVDDVGFVQHWKPIIEKIAATMVRSYHLPESNLDDLMSSGMLGLCRVPKDARWNANYVWRLVRNTMITELRKSTLRYSRFELWGNPPDTQAAKDGIHDRLSIEFLVTNLSGREGHVTKLFLAGYTDIEIARDIGSTVRDAKLLLTAAIATMQKCARINQEQPEQESSRNVTRLRCAAV